MNAGASWLPACRAAARRPICARWRMSGYEAVDNPPLRMLEEMVARGDSKLAVGIDARTRGFDAVDVLDAVDRLRAVRC